MIRCKLYARGGGSQEREVADGADVVFTDTATSAPSGSGNYRRLPKAGLKIEYKPNVSGVVANLELGERLGSGVQGWSGVSERSPPEAESFFVSGYLKLSFIGSSSAAGSPRVESLVKTFASLAGPIFINK